ncbi:MAG: radical SAM/SPASM domain-containing protein [Bacillota bacterium]
MAKKRWGKIKLKTIADNKYRFAYSFDLDSGFYYRTGIIDQEGNDTGTDPFRSSFPHLLDVGIMGHCVHGAAGLCLQAGVQCYQNGLEKNEPNMSLEDYKSIIDQCKDKLFQIALGGRGDPEMHESFLEILSYSRENEIIPNMTTSGFGLTTRHALMIKEHCGAAAVSWYRSPYTLKAIELLLSLGIKTNIHYVLGNNTIDEAFDLLCSNKFPAAINRIIFLLHKPVGMGESKNVLNPLDPKVKEFFNLLNMEEYINKVGFDSCCIPGIINFSPKIHLNSIDTCEGARYSAYISPNMVMTPCSFDQQYQWGLSLKQYSIKEVWESQPFEIFRSTLKMSCPECDKKKDCLGGCPIKKEIVLCAKKQEVK